MAEAPQSIFSKKATDKLRNPDDLELFIRVTNPSVWVVLIACVALVAGLLCWGFFGSVTTSIDSRGAVVNNKAVCYLTHEDVAKVSDGEEATFNGVNLVISDVASVPLSREEAHAELGSDYLVASLVESDWVYKVTFDGDVSDLPQNVPLDVSITAERITPISLILKNWG